MQRKYSLWQGLKYLPDTSCCEANLMTVMPLSRQESWSSPGTSRRQLCQGFLRPAAAARPCSNRQLRGKAAACDWHKTLRKPSKG